MDDLIVSQIDVHNSCCLIPGTTQIRVMIHESGWYPKLPKWSIPTQKIDIDNNTRFHYQVGYWCPLIDASICGAVADPGTQLSVFDSSALKKQYLIFQLSGGMNHG
jgi:hypothetical protein